MAKRGHGEGSYKRNASGSVSWRVRVTYPDGTGERRTGTAPNMTQAREAVRAALEEASAGVRPVSDRLTVAEMVTEYMEAKRQAWAARTYFDAEVNYRRYIAGDLGSLRAAGLDPKRFRAYFAALEERGLGYSGQRQVYTLLNGAYKRAIGDGLLRDNPLTYAKPERSKDTGPARPKHFQPAELRQFIEAAKEDRWALVLAFMGFTGLRLGEALALTWEDVGEDIDGGAYVSVTKTLSHYAGELRISAPKTAKSRRKVPLSSDAVGIIEDMRRHVALEARQHGKDWPGKTGPLFPSPYTGDFMRQDTARKTMLRVCERAGLPYRPPHALRHSAATFQVSRGADPVHVAGMLGHSQTSTTLNLYAHALPDRVRALAFGLEDLDPAKEESGEKQG